MSELDLHFLSKHTNKYEVRLEKYGLKNLFPAKPNDDNFPDENRERFPAMQDIPNFTEPKICTWAFLGEEDVNKLINCKNLNLHRKLLAKKLCSSYPKDGPKIIAVDLLYSALKFARTAHLTVAQTATLLSIFYLTHSYFTCSYTATAEDVFYYFKELLSHHSLDYVPDYVRIFESETAQKIFAFFCKIYLRHLPIVRLLTLPNFNFELNLTIEPLPVFKKPKKVGDKKGKKDKKKKKK